MSHLFLIKFRTILRGLSEVTSRVCLDGTRLSEELNALIFLILIWGQQICPYFSNPNIITAGFVEMSTHIYHSTRCHTPEDYENTTDLKEFNLAAPRIQAASVATLS